MSFEKTKLSFFLAKTNLTQIQRCVLVEPKQIYESPRFLIEGRFGLALLKKPRNKLGIPVLHQSSEKEITSQKIRQMAEHACKDPPLSVF
jgi:hypothetical protein